VDVEFKVSEALIDDVGKGWARLNPEDLQGLGAVLGDLIEITGKKKTVGRVTGTLGQGDERGNIQIDGLIRANAQINVGDTVKLKKVPAKPRLPWFCIPWRRTPPCPMKPNWSILARCCRATRLF